MSRVVEEGASPREVKKNIFSFAIRMFANAFLTGLAIYGMVYSLLGLQSTYDFRYILMLIICIGGLIRVGYDVAKDIQEFEHPVPRSLEGIITNFILRGSLTALGIYMALQILTSWHIPYPHNWALLGLVIYATSCIVYDMIRDFGEYHAYAMYVKKRANIVLKRKYWTVRDKS